jgi:hypothetical protein
MITWLSTVDASFGSAKDGKFLALAHSNFKHIRYVEEEAKAAEVRERCLVVIRSIG